MKNGKFVVGIMLILLMLAGCSQEQQPAEAVEEFLDAAKDMDYESAACYVDSSSVNGEADFKGDFLTSEETEEITDSTEAFTNYFESNLKKLDYEIVETEEIDEQSAVVTVDVSYVDSKPVIQAAFGELIVQAFSMAFSEVEMSEEEQAEMFEGIFAEKVESTPEKVVDETIEVSCVKQEEEWYISQPNKALFNAITAGLYSADEIFGELTEEGYEESEMNNQDRQPEDVLHEIDNYIVGDLWNEGFIEVSYYLDTGKGSMGQELDIDLTKDMLGDAMEEKPEYDTYINGLGEEYSRTKEVWNKLSQEADKLYEQIQQGEESINVDLFQQYMYAYSDLLYE
ncbi:MAG TPA: hypothetical protein DHN33_01375 [Eubacteriaceae bacterium]|nr:hypothetical protein [Eubacteriaceae bacterium]